MAPAQPPVWSSSGQGAQQMFSLLGHLEFKTLLMCSRMKSAGCAAELQTIHCAGQGWKSYPAAQGMVDLSIANKKTYKKITLSISNKSSLTFFQIPVKLKHDYWGEPLWQTKENATLPKSSSETPDNFAIWETNSHFSETALFIDFNYISIILIITSAITQSYEMLKVVVIWS